jgi:hypothetical protein
MLIDEKYFEIKINRALKTKAPGFPEASQLYFLS